MATVKLSEIKQRVYNIFLKEGLSVEDAEIITEVLTDAQVKGILAKNKLRYEHKGELEPDPDRDYRLLPSERFKARIGVAEFDTGVPELIEDGWIPKRIVLPLRQHIGASAEAIVKVGDKVTAGQLVAGAVGMISANIHSSVNGTVASVSASEIAIDVFAG